MDYLAPYKKIIKTDIPLAMHTWLQLGGRAEYFAEPRDEAELARLLEACRAGEIAVHVLGLGTNLLPSDDGVPGMVIRLTAPVFGTIETDSSVVVAGAGAKLGRVITAAVYSGLAGLEGLIGIPGTVGGAVWNNIASRDGDIGQVVDSVRVVTAGGEIQDRSRDELVFGPGGCSLENAVITACRFRLVPEEPDELARRLQKLWIVRKKSQPMGHQGSAWLFKDPRGESASELIESAGLKGTRIGGAVVCDRDPNFVIVEPDCSSHDVRRLARLIQSQVREHSAIELELGLDLW